MVEPRTNRRLAAILAADVVGYSRMMARDETGTLAAMKRHRDAVFDPAVAQHNGRIVKLMGDGTLVEFGSVVDAVNCALAIQRTITTETAAGPPIVLRIGVNLGDIVVDGDDIYGDGVNVAARLEPLAEAGGICVASIVNDSIGGRVDVAFTDSGEVQVKNIDRPIRIWKWHPTSSAGSPSPTASPQAERGVLPSLAVLPFHNLSGDATQDYFADGIVDDLITALSRFKSFAVVSRNSSFVYKNRPVDVRTAAKELGVRYVLEGSARRAGSTLRVSAQLVDGEAGTQLWSKRYEGKVEDIFAVQDEIVEGVVGVLEPEIQRAEILRSRRDRPSSAAAYDLYLRGLYAMHTTAPEDNATAFTLFDRAAAMEPENGTYLIDAAWTMAFARAMGWPGIDTSIRRQVELAHRAVEAAPRDGEVLARATMILIHGSREYDLAAVMIARALEANPNSFWVMTCAGIWHIHCGELEQALHYFKRVLELSPNDLNVAHTLTGVAHVYMAMGRYDDALSWAERSFAVNHRLSATYWMLAAANALLGRVDLARHYVALLMEVAPGTTLATLRAGQPAKIPSRIEPILEGLRLAGLPED